MFQACHANQVSYRRLFSVGAFVEAYLYDDLLVFNKKCDQAPMHTQVDDCMQIMFGTAEAVRDVLVRGAIHWHAASAKLKLIVSDKSVVVTSKAILSKAIVHELSTLGINMKSHDSARDVGITFTGGKHRNQGIILDRMSKARNRCAKVSNLAKSVRAARKLFPLECSHKVPGVMSNSVFPNTKLLCSPRWPCLALAFQLLVGAPPLQFSCRMVGGRILRRS